MTVIFEGMKFGIVTIENKGLASQNKIASLFLKECSTSKKGDTNTGRIWKDECFAIHIYGKKSADLLISGLSLPYTKRCPCPFGSHYNLKQV